MLLARRLTLVATLIAATHPATAETVTGLARVKDGDSLVVAGREIRLGGIDAPEMSQRGAGRYARKALTRHLEGREVTCAGDVTDRYGRMVAECSVGGRSVNDWLVRQGLAFAYWPYRQAETLAPLPCPDDTKAECHRTTATLMALEQQARDDQVGIWGFRPLPVYPWCARHPEQCRASSERYP